jgi:hypothetical protein
LATDNTAADDHCDTNPGAIVSWAHDASANHFDTNVDNTGAHDDNPAATGHYARAEHDQGVHHRLLVV